MRARIEQISDTHEAHIYEANMDDVKAVADHCQRLQNAGEFGANDMRCLGVVPTIIVQKYINENGITYSEFMRNPSHATRLLNDPQYAAFRVSKGRV